MADESWIDLEACRFCLKTPKRRRDKIKIDEKIKKNFQSLMNEYLLDSSYLPQTCCSSCLSEITTSLEVKEKISKIQEKLLEFLQTKSDFESAVVLKTEFIENTVKINEFETEDLIKTEENFEIKTEIESDNFNFGNLPEAPETILIEIKKTEKKTGKAKVGRPRTSTRHIKLICDYCGSKKSHKKGMMAHMERQHNKFEAFCKICEKNFKTFLSYKAHYKYTHEIGHQKICEYCGLRFRSFAPYIKHIRINHTGEKPFACDKCGKKFAMLSILKNHLKNVHSEETIYCEICSKMFHSQLYLKNHKKILHEGHKYYCDFTGCTLFFATRNSLKLHKVSHTEQRNFHCKLCDSSYKYRKSLETHLLSTHYKMEYKCEMYGCTASYFRKDFLRSHVKSKHLNLTPEEREQAYENIRRMPIPSLKEYLKIGRKTENS